LSEPKERVKADVTEEKEDSTLNREEKKKKARLRRRGPYRKAHVNW
jgi:hypothetical protein